MEPGPTERTSEMVANWLPHFAEEGITAPVRGMQVPGVIAVEEIEGDRLMTVLEEGRAVDEWAPMFAELGYKVGYISACSIEHNDLHAGNVIAERQAGGYGECRIIDWELARWNGIQPAEGEEYGTWMERNSDRFLDDIRTRLTDAGYDDRFPALRDRYETMFRAGLDADTPDPQRVQHY
ncbi:MAG: hypothetical protein SVU88_02565 [Candidatus Nanohaloarchaea archaeon]|nr:hypothetical protein [Candidatus Nanohaloarchaea archaeon]